MVLKRLSTVLFSPALVFVILSTVLPYCTVVPAAVTPEREIVAVDAPEVPQWKKTWDIAREYARNGEFARSADSYHELILIKPQIEEARWEYCKVLLELDEYSTVSTILEGLIEKNSNRLDYLEMAGQVALIKREYERAVSYLGQVYSQRPEGASGVQALQGLIKGLQGLGQKTFAYPLMEQLYQRTNDAPQLLQDLARYAVELGYDTKAKEYYTTLITKFRVTDEILFEAAKLFDVPGEEERALPFWLKYLERKTDYLPYHKKALQYYLGSGQQGLALSHILYVVDHDRDRDDELLLEAARLYLQEENRPDKALEFLERYFSLYPDRKDIMAEIQNVREIMAEKLLAIVENDGADLLWQDLAQLTKDRLAIFMMIAGKLEEQGKSKELIDILRIIHQHTSEKDSLALRIARLYKSRKDYGMALSYLHKVAVLENRTYDYYKDRGWLEEKLDHELAALKSYTYALELRPEALRLRIRALRIAGIFGFVDEITKLYTPLRTEKITVESLDAHLTYIESLRQSGFFTQVSALYTEILKNDIPERQRFRILLHQADTLQLWGKAFEAQRVLWMLLTEDIENTKVLEKLIAFSIENHEVEDGWKWFSCLSGQVGRGFWKTQYDQDGRRLFSLYIRLLEAGNKLGIAVDELQAYRYLLKKTSAKGEYPKIIVPFDKLLCRLYLKKNDYSSCTGLLEHYKNSGAEDVEFTVLRHFALMAGNTSSPQALEGMFDEAVAGHFKRLLSAVQEEVQLGKTRAALFHLKKALAIYPNSLRATLLQAEILSDAGMLSAAVELFDDLRNRYPQEIYFLEKKLHIDSKLGNYGNVLAESALEYQPDAPLQVNLLRARSFWAINERQEAINLYQTLLEPSAHAELLEKLQLSEPSIQMISSADSLWGLFSFTGSGQVKWLTDMVDPVGFIPLRKTPEGRVIADMYARFRWEKLVRNEYLARRAVLAKKYIAAEKQYKRTIKEDQSTEGLMDLARIYERLGNYGKEAEVYDEIEKHGQETQELVDSIERNRLTRAPRLSLDFEHFEKQGRNASVDLKKQSGGTGFWFMPELSSEVLLKYYEISYTSVIDGAPTTTGREFSGLGSFEISEDTQAHVGAGIHMLDSAGDTLLCYDLGIAHQMDEIVKGYFVYNQGIVDDTLAALEAGIYSRSATVGLELEAPSGFSIGGDYRRLKFSDENTQDRLYLWSAYSLFSDYTTLEFKYDYELQKNNQTNVQIIDEINGSVSNSLPYWSPDNYWQHRINLHFQHLLKDFEAFGGAPSYYAIDFAVGFESDDNIRYTGGFDIFLEMNSNFLLKGELLYSKADDYYEKSAFLSLIYRW